MMDELDLLKKDWQKKTSNLPTVASEEIFAIIAKKSTSIVKWIFIISIVELVFWIVLNFIPLEETENNHPIGQLLEQIVNVIEYLSFGVILYFIYKFYTNFKKIEITSSAKVLMRQILITRKTVERYVWFNIGLTAFTGLLFILSTLIFSDGEIAQKLQEGGLLYMVIYLSLFLVFIGIIIGILWLFYRLLYGILLKRLHDNYNEIRKLEV